MEIYKEQNKEKGAVLFSIGIPAFKARFLPECIESILIQTYQNYELIILNDCSPDDIKSIVAGYNNNRIRYLENDVNVGAEHVIDNWNKCLYLAKGEYFVLMSDDDKMEPDYLEEFMKLIEKYPELDVYHCRSKIINEHSVAYELTLSCPEYESTYNYIWHVLNSKRNKFISDFVFRSSALIGKNGFYKLPLAWSSDYVTAFMSSGDKGIAHHRKALFNYRISPYNITATSNIDLKRKAVISYEGWLGEFLEKKPVTEEDKIIYPLLKKSFLRSVRFSKVGFIRQKIGSHGLRGLIQCWVKRKTFELSFSDVVKAISISISNKT